MNSSFVSIVIGLLSSPFSGARPLAALCTKQSTIAITGEFLKRVSIINVTSSSVLFILFVCDLCVQCEHPAATGTTNG